MIIRQDWTEEVLFSVYSESWKREMPVTLITYKGGSMDIHCQTGNHYKTAMEKAEQNLNQRGLKIDLTKSGIIGPSGIYRDVVKID